MCPAPRPAARRRPLASRRCATRLRERCARRRRGCCWRCRWPAHGRRARRAGPPRASGRRRRRPRRAPAPPRRRRPCRASSRLRLPARLRVSGPSGARARRRPAIGPSSCACKRPGRMARRSCHLRSAIRIARPSIARALRPGSATGGAVDLRPRRREARRRRTMAAPGRPYESFIVLLDDPADRPRLGFDVYADAFAQIVEHSQPQFAIGIFGDWGSGKTTLMRAIEQRIRAKPDLMLPVWFNAWRYEREEHLIVPLLDNLREALVDWSAEHADEATAARARRAASKFGRAGRALLRGLTIKGGLPGLEAT